jgi:D-glycero-D-manno-heptose 1,7-bisphosphate phosphatase
LRQGSAQSGSPQNGAVFFDRDGCLNEDIGYLHEWAKFRWLPGAINAVRLANEAGLRTFVVTNQSGIARGYYTAGDVHLIHRHMAAELAEHGAWIDAFRYCPHHPDHGEHARCACRKPASGMIADLMQSWNIAPRRAFMVGDRETDVTAAEGAGIKGIQVEPGNVLAVVRREIARLG